MTSIVQNLACVLCCILFAVLPLTAASHVDDPTHNSLVVVFNQPKYAPGDTVFFTGFLLSKEYQLTQKKKVVSIKLLGQSNNTILHERVLFLDGVGINQFIIPSTVEQGVYQVVFFIETSFTNSVVLYIGRIVISGKNKIITTNQTSLAVDNSKINIVTDRATYSTRSKVNVSITPGTGLKKTMPTVLSIAVYNEQLFMNGNMSTSSVLCMSPHFIQQETNFSTSNDFPYYFIGKAVSESTKETVPDHSKVTFYLNESDFAYEVYTLTGGYFTFPLLKNFGSEKVYYKISHNGNVLNDAQIIIHDLALPSEISISEVAKYELLDTLDVYGLYAQQRFVINKSYRYFTTKEKKNETNEEPDDDIQADQEILLDKFEPFSSMADVFTNVVPMVGYKKFGESERIRVFLKRTAKYGERDPLYVVNGTMTDDTKYILSLDPLRVKKIGVLRSEQALGRFGDLGREGILVIETTDGKPVEGVRNSLFIEGISKAMSYHKLAYNESELKSRVPDLRSSLYWNSTVNLGEQTSFDFYTSDDTGYYIIQIVGIQDGRPFLSTSRFYVSNTAQN